MRENIIGGMFGLTSTIPIVDMNLPPFIHRNAKLLVNARSGINIIVHQLKPLTIWMPAYLCNVMLKAVAGFDVRFFPINEKLSIVDDFWISQIVPGDLVVFISYFGFPIDASYVAAAKNQGAWVLEDAAQALLSSNVGEFADFIIYSPRKHLGVPDGGVVVSRKSFDGWKEIKLQEPPSRWWLKVYASTLLRRDFDHQGGERKWFRMFQETDRSAPIGAYAMSELSKKLLLHGFDYDEIRRKRIENYQFLMEKLEQYAIFPKLLPGVVPIGFPIRLENRDHVRCKLSADNIYPPIHWELSKVVPVEFIESHKLSNQIMTLPCDQRYDLADMERMAEIVLRNL